VNQFRFRFETDAASPLSQEDILNLYSALSKDFTISSIEILNMWGDKKAYSLAQGQ
jgi:isocitrate dehydrogenase